MGKGAGLVDGSCADSREGDGAEVGFVDPMVARPCQLRSRHWGVVGGHLNDVTHATVLCVFPEGVPRGGGP